ncbi:MAG: formylglycine-generating enzyme family protein [Anaerolineae bacterium]|nr:formylglycine-generating enzyme family protein [Anaerolineae bacterium]
MIDRHTHVRFQNVNHLLVLALLIALMSGCTYPSPHVAASPASTPPVADEDAYKLAETGVTRNADWIPYTEVIDGVEMALVPAGCFMMGSDDGGRFEQPVHQVCFEEPFWIDMTEVTQTQFERFGGKAGQGNHFSGFLTGEDLPRESITWDESDAFCRQRGVRLPTDAEWEYAARGPDGLVYPWGDAFVPDNVVYAYGPDPATRAREVGSKLGGASWVGALDLTGNVEEWVNDRFSETYYSELPDGAVNPQGPDTGTSRVRRGGGWNPMDPLCLRASFRVGGGNPSRMATNHLGLRCARSYEK